MNRTFVSFNLPISTRKLAVRETNSDAFSSAGCVVSHSGTVLQGKSMLQSGFGAKELNMVLRMSEGFLYLFFFICVGNISLHFLPRQEGDDVSLSSALLKRSTGDFIHSFPSDKLCMSVKKKLSDCHLSCSGFQLSRI